jgi:hypothetical protein
MVVNQKLDAAWRKYVTRVSARRTYGDEACRAAFDEWLALLQKQMARERPKSSVAP